MTTLVERIVAADHAHDVFEAMFDRPKNGVDIMTMAESRAIDLDIAADRLESVLGDDPHVGRLRHPSR